MQLRHMVLVLVFALTACAQSDRWENPAAPKERWSADRATCKRLAAREAERDYAKQQRLSGMDYTGQTSTHQSRMAVYETRKEEIRVFEACMARKGYVKVKDGQE